MVKHVHILIHVSVATRASFQQVFDVEYVGSPNGITFTSTLIPTYTNYIQSNVLSAASSRLKTDARVSSSCNVATLNIAVTFDTTTVVNGGAGVSMSVQRESLEFLIETCHKRYTYVIMVDPIVLRALLFQSNFK